MSKGLFGSGNDSRISIGLLGGAVGGAGWIVGMAFGLVRQAAKAQPRPVGIDDDIAVVSWCAAAVFLTGVVLCVLGVAGLRFSKVFECEALLGASFVFGTIALVWMDVRGVLPLAVLGNADDGQPGSQIWVDLSHHLPTRLAYGAPLLLLAFMAAAWWPRSRKWLFGAAGIAGSTRWVSLGHGLPNEHPSSARQLDNPVMRIGYPKPAFCDLKTEARSIPNGTARDTITYGSAKMSTTTFDRDSMAAWYAREHLKTDPGIVSVYYLPKNAGDREIRFIEVNELLADRNGNALDPIDFGVDTGTETAHKLLDLDVTPAQWQKINAQQLSLPGDWSLDGATHWEQ